MNDDRSSQGWWSTLPGLLTAAATAITAIGGLIAVLGQTGLFHASKSATPPIAASGPAAGSRSADTSAATNVSATTVADAQSKTAIATSSTPAAQASPPSAGGDIGSNMSYFAGSWQNINPSANGILRIQIRISESTMYVRAWAKCRPTDCDWGEVEAQGFGSGMGSQPAHGVRIVTAQFRNNIRETALTIHPAQNNRIRVEAATNFVDQSGRAPIARIFLFQRM